nr:two-component regulator propeller domain-containing protein [Granulicella aggregans]
MRVAGSIALLLCLCRGVSAAASGAAPHAETASQSLANYAARVWQTKDGLPQQTVQAVAQTPDGFLWIGTTGGLLRFDGSRFVLFDRSTTPAFQENSVFSLMTARDGTLWIGSEGGGLLHLENGEFHRFGVTEGLADGFVRTVLEDREGTIWIGTDNGLFKLPRRAARAVRVDGVGAIPLLTVHSITQAADGAIWVGGSQLLEIRDGVATNWPLAGEYSETTVKSILQTRDGTMWVGTVSGLQRLSKGTTRFGRFAGVQGTVRVLRETSDGTLWIGTIGQGVFTLRGGRLESIESSQPGVLNLPSKTVLSLFEDSEHNLWLGTQAGVARFSRSSVKLVPLPNASDSDFGTISLDSDGTLWAASTGLSHLVNGVATPKVFPELNGARVRNVFRAFDGALWIGTDGRGLFRLGNGSAVHYTMADGLVNDFVRGILETRSGDLWIATDGGVSRLSHGVFSSYKVKEGLVYSSVRSMLEDRAGDVWFGTDRGVSHFADGRFVQDAVTAALAQEKVWALHQSASGALWFGTPDNGLYRYVAGEAKLTHYTTEQGLASDSIYSILEDARQRFWMSGAGGVAVVSVADLEEMARHARTNLSQRFIAVAEGGRLSPLYGGTQPSGVITADGDAWFPTSRGPVQFFGDESDASPPPKVFLDQVVADGRTFSAQGGPIELSANNRNLEISYGSILLAPQDAVQFLYKLDGFEDAWRYGTNRRVADYTNLPAGHYTFRVRALDGSGRMTERTVALYKQQYFFLTWWFLSCCAAAVVVLIWWVHRQKLRRVEAAFQAVLQERARLAREMHDTLIQGCAGVSLLLEACSIETGGNSAQAELLDYARTQLASSMDEARQAVWNLRGEESLDFGETLMKLAERVNRSSNIEVECVIEGSAYDFHASAIHEVSMASREAIYNALLHANPTRVDVRACFREEEFTLSVVDDGSGFESSDRIPQGHYGLMGIKERISRLGGNVKVESARSRGTSVSIRLPRAAVCSLVPREAALEKHPMGEVTR